MEARVHETTLMNVADMRPHPDNYRDHPDDQRDHIRQSIREHGFYRNVVVASDGTILAGHGVWESAVEEGLTQVPVVRLDIPPDHPKALKILTGDNELSRLAGIDDRKLSELLKQIKEQDIDGLLGTGYDEQMLASLVYVTRPASEVQDFDEAAAWVGLPEYDSGEQPWRFIVSFDTEEDRDEFVKQAGHWENVGEKAKMKPGDRAWSAWWPPRPVADMDAVRFQ